MNNAQPTKRPIDKLVEQLQEQGEVQLTDEGTSHGTQRKYQIELVGKFQRLNCLFGQKDLEVIDLVTKRSGSVCRTSISVKTAIS
ncbi:hypothetical protein [Spirosoma koreense]